MIEISEFFKSPTETRPTVYVYQELKNNISEWKIAMTCGEATGFPLLEVDDNGEWYCVTREGLQCGSRVEEILCIVADPDFWTFDRLMDQALCDKLTYTLRECKIKRNAAGEYFVDAREIVRQYNPTATSTPYDSLIAKIEEKIDDCDCHYDGRGLHIEYGNNLIAYINGTEGRYKLTIDVLDYERNTYNIIDNHYSTDDAVVNVIARFDISYHPDLAVDFKVDLEEDDEK